MNSGAVQKVALLATLLVLALFVLPGAIAQTDPADTTVDSAIKDRTMQGDPGTPSGDIIGPIYEKIIWTSVAVFLLVAIIMVYIMVRFRHRRGVKVDVPQIHGNSKMEIAWTIGPALVMFWILVISFNGMQAIDEPPGVEPEVYVDVMASRFLWTFEYPDGTEASGRLADGTSPVLRLPSDTWIRLNVTSADVIHAIRIPGLDVMIDANPGRMNHVSFFARDPGVYLVQCFQYCGVGHGEMLAAVEIFEKGSQERPYGPAEVPQADENATAPGAAIDPNDLPPAESEFEVDAFDFGFDPAPLEAELGQTVRIKLTNIGNSPHNLFIGEYDWQNHNGSPVCDPPADEPTGIEGGCWATSNLAPGEETYLQFTVPEESLGLTLWCDVSGHAEAGMLSYFSVAGALPEGAEDGQVEPRLPAPGAALVVAAIGALAIFIGRRRE